MQARPSSQDDEQLEMADAARSLRPVSLSQQLSSSIKSTDELLGLLVPPLAQMDLLSDDSELASRYQGTCDIARLLKRQIGLVQKVLIAKVWPDWSHALTAELGPERARRIIDRWFVPPSCVKMEHATIAASALSVLRSLLSTSLNPPLSPPALEITLERLARLSGVYTIQTAYQAIFSSNSSPAEGIRADAGADAQWRMTVNDFMSLPTRVANAVGLAASVQGNGPWSMNIPSDLEYRTYLASLTRSHADLLWQIAQDRNTSITRPQADLSNLSLPWCHLTNTPDFWTVLLKRIINRLLPPQKLPAPALDLASRHAFRSLCREVSQALPQRDYARFTRGMIRAVVGGHAADATVVQRVRGAAFVLSEVLGPLEHDSGAWKIILDNWTALVSANDFEIPTRTVIAWACESDDVEGRPELLKHASNMWCEIRGIKEASPIKRTSITALFLSVAAALSSQHRALVDLSRSSPFLAAISAHLSSLDPTTRYLGMLAAEYISERTVTSMNNVQPLSFGEEVWSAAGEARIVTDNIRRILRDLERVDTVTDGWQDYLREAWTEQPEPVPLARPPAPMAQAAATTKQTSSTSTTRRPLISIIDDDEEDDDDLQPYPLPAPPSAATLDALASEDASLYATALPQASASTTRKRGKLRPPVYVPELTAYLKGVDPDGGKKEEADGEAERVELGLREGEGLVRRKTGWGGELNENAVDLTFALMGLQDQYELDNFESLKLGIMAALVVAVPTKVAPAIIEQYFTPHYSAAQRHTMLMALALASRELAGLSIPAQPGTDTRKAEAAAFPSKQLPPALHRRLVQAGVDTGGAPPPDPLDRITAEVADLTLSAVREESEANVPGAGREKLLTVRRFASAKADSKGHSALSEQSQRPSFAPLAAEYFIMPLINRFWLHLRDSATPLITRSSPYATTSGSGKDSIGAGSLLTPLMLSKYVSTLTILVHASRHSQHFLLMIAPAALQLGIALRTTAIEGGGYESDEQVLEAEMELLLVIFDAVVSLDRGESLLGRNVEGGSELVGEAKEWAEQTFERDEARGAHEVVSRAARAAAGVLLRIDEITSRWRLHVGW